MSPGATTPPFWNTSGMCYPERRWMPHPWKHPRSGCRSPCSGSWDQMAFKSPTEMILWFCDSFWLRSKSLGQWQADTKGRLWGSAPAVRHVHKPIIWLCYNQAWKQQSETWSPLFCLCTLSSGIETHPFFIHWLKDHISAARILTRRAEIVPFAKSLQEGCAWRLIRALPCSAQTTAKKKGAEHKRLSLAGCEDASGCWFQCICLWGHQV